MNTPAPDSQNLVRQLKVQTMANRHAMLMRTINAKLIQKIINQ